MAGDRRRTSASVAHRHYHPIAFSLDFSPKLWVIFEVCPNFGPDDPVRLRISFGQNLLHLNQELMGVSKTYVYDAM